MKVESMEGTNCTIQSVCKQHQAGRFSLEARQPWRARQPSACHDFE